MSTTYPTTIAGETVYVYGERHNEATVLYPDEKGAIVQEHDDESETWFAWKDLPSKPYTAKAKAQREQEEARDTLRAILPPGSTVYANMVSVSASGMSRVYTLHVAVIDAESKTPYIRDITGLVATATGDKMNTNMNTGWGIKVGGCGMDMGFALVYGLSRTLYPNGHKCAGKGKNHRCPSNDHSNDYGMLAREYGAAHADDEYELRYRDHAAREEYVSARQAWIAAQEGRLWSKRRTHSDGGYAISKRDL